MIPDGLEPSFSGCRPGVVAAGPRNRKSRGTRDKSREPEKRFATSSGPRLSTLRSRLSMDSPGVAPGSPVCRTGVLLLDHEPVRCASRCSSSVVSGSRGTRTHKRLSAATCFRDRLLIRPDDFQELRDEGQESRAKEKKRGSLVHQALVFRLSTLVSFAGAGLEPADS